MPRNRQDILLELLIVRCRRGEDAAFEELIREWEPRLIYFVRRLVCGEEDAYEVLQKTWVRVFRNLASLKDAARFKPWLYRIARNTALNYGRTSQSYQAALQNSPPEIRPGEVEFDDQFENAEEVHKGLLQLSLPHREILTLYFLNEWSVVQIAEVLNLPVGTVKSRMYHAKQALREALIKRGVCQNG